MTKAMASMSVGGRELVLLFSSSPLMPSAPLTRLTLLSANAGAFVPGKISIKNSSRQKVYIGSLRRVRPPTVTPAPPSSPSMKTPCRASCDRGALSLKRYLLRIKVLLYSRRCRLHPMFWPTKRERSLSASTLSFISRAPAEAPWYTESSGNYQYQYCSTFTLCARHRSPHRRHHLHHLPTGIKSPRVELDVNTQMGNSGYRYALKICVLVYTLLMEFYCRYDRGSLRP